MTASPANAPRPPVRKGLAHAAIAAASVIAVSFTGQFATAPALPVWYAELAKPSFTPPNWAFPVAWTTLFTLMAIAFWRVLRAPARTPGRRTAIWAYAAQLALNVSWSFAFFGARSPLLGLIVVIPFWLAILATMLAFRRVDRLAAALLIPYAGWVAFAAVLNATIWRIN